MARRKLSEVEKLILNDRMNEIVIRDGYVRDLVSKSKVMTCGIRMKSGHSTKAYEREDLFVCCLTGRNSRICGIEIKISKGQTKNVVNHINVQHEVDVGSRKNKKQLKITNIVGEKFSPGILTDRIKDVYLTRHYLEINASFHAADSAAASVEAM